MKSITIRGSNGHEVGIDLEIDGMTCRCGGTFSAGYERTKERRPLVLHSQPECAKFMELEPPDFLAYVRMGDA